MLKIFLFFIILIHSGFSTSSDEETCNVTTYPHDYFRILPAMVPYQFNETYEVIEVSNSTGALCLDGTNYKFYWTRGTGEGANKFMFFFQGAGYCGSDGNEFLASCYSRTSTEYGSSSTWGSNGSFASSVEALGYFSSNETHNPKFWNWNKIVVKYCDGTNNQGYLEDPVDYNGTKLWFRGYNNTLSVFEYAKTHLNLFQASHIILTGSSSGAVSSMQWIQYLAKYYIPSSIKLVGLPDGGLFIDFYNEKAGCNLYRHNNMVVANFTNSKTLELFKPCKYYNTSEIWKCFLPQYFYKQIESPLFIVNAIYDCEELATSYGIPCVVYGADTCTEEDRIKLVKFQEKFFKVILKVKKHKPRWGYWARACFEHIYYNTWAWYGDMMNTFSAEINEAQSFRTAFYDWYDNLDKNGTKSTFIDLEDWLHSKNCVKYKDARPPYAS